MIVRTTSAHPSGFYIFGCGDKDIEGEYRVTRETFNDIPVFLSPNGCRLFRQVTILWIDQMQIHQGQSTWILQKKNENTAAYYINSADVIPPRFNWVTPVQKDYPRNVPYVFS